MKLVTRILLVLGLTIPFAGAFAQETTPPPSEPGTELSQTDETSAAATETAVETEEAEEAEYPSSYRVREGLMNVLRSQPPELMTILALDPSLLSNDAFLVQYPRLAEYVAEYPEVRRNTRFYLGQVPIPNSDISAIDDFLEVIIISVTMLLIALALAWLVRTIIEQRRWNRLSKTQAEVHNRILDRFETNDELLAYIRTPAGAKFLESAPIPLSTEQPVTNAPMARILWSIQIGVVIAAGAIGLLLVSTQFDKQTAQDLFAMGVIAFCVGGGFVGSALVSLMLSKKLGLWQPPQTPDTASDRSSLTPGL